MTPTSAHIDALRPAGRGMADRIETPRLTLRPLGAQDEAATVAFYQSDRAQYTGGNPVRFQAWKNFAAMLGHWHTRGYGLWAVTERGNDAILGMVGPYFPETWPETELGWVMFEGSEGKGYAHEAAVAARRHAYDVLGWTSIVSYISEGNARSIALAERLGCKIDPTAELPPHANGKGLVYRHPAREASQ